MNRCASSVVGDEEVTTGLVRVAEPIGSPLRNAAQFRGAADVARIGALLFSLKQDLAVAGCL